MTADAESSQRAGAEVRAFHARLPGYAPTPLTDLPALAAELGVARVLVKDESSRLGLPAFKILGASWAIARLLAERAGGSAPVGEIDLEALRALVSSDPITFVTATDGNHGRAVARMAALVGAGAEVFVPDVTDQVTVDLIAGEGAPVTRVAGEYDLAVRRAAERAAAIGAALVQDTGWDGYTRVPGWIVAGYSTLLAEIDDVVVPDLIVVPVGVGSLAQAVVDHYHGSPTRVLSVEPDSADCLRRSLIAGQPVVVKTGFTAMAGLNCGTVSELAWPHLRDGISAAVAVSEAEASAAMRDLAALGVSSGPSGAATLGGVRQLKLDALGLDRVATIVLLSTEAARA